MSEREQKLIEAVKRLIEGCEEIRKYRAHLSGCEVEQTDFCTCGRKEAADLAWKAITFGNGVLAAIKRGEL